MGYACKEELGPTGQDPVPPKLDRSPATILDHLLIEIGLVAESEYRRSGLLGGRDLEIVEIGTPHLAVGVLRRQNRRSSRRVS